MSAQQQQPGNSHANGAAAEASVSSTDNQQLSPDTTVIIRDVAFLEDLVRTLQEEKSAFVKDNKEYQVFLENWMSDSMDKDKQLHKYKHERDEAKRELANEKLAMAKQIEEIRNQQSQEHLNLVALLKTSKSKEIKAANEARDIMANAGITKAQLDSKERELATLRKDFDDLQIKADKITKERDDRTTDLAKCKIDLDASAGCIKKMKEEDDRKQKELENRAKSLETSQNSLVSANKTISQLKADVDKKQKELETTKGELTTERNKTTGLQKDLNDKKTELSNTATELTSTKTDLSTERDTSAGLKKDLDERTEQLRNKKEKLMAERKKNLSLGKTNKELNEIVDKLKQSYNEVFTKPSERTEEVDEEETVIDSDNDDQNGGDGSANQGGNGNGRKDDDNNGGNGGSIGGGGGSNGASGNQPGSSNGKDKTGPPEKKNGAQGGNKNGASGSSNGNSTGKKNGNTGKKAEDPTSLNGGGVTESEAKENIEEKMEVRARDLPPLMIVEDEDEPSNSGDHNPSESITTSSLKIGSSIEDADANSLSDCEIIPGSPDNEVILLENSSSSKHLHDGQLPSQRRSEDIGIHRQGNASPEPICIGGTVPPADELFLTYDGTNYCFVQIKGLAEETKVNDTLIDLYLDIIQNRKIPQKIREKTNTFPSQFYNGLTNDLWNTRPDSLSEEDYANYRYNCVQNNYLARRKEWTKYVDIFAQDFLVIPIHHVDNEKKYEHWYLAIVVKPSKCVVPRKKSSEEENKKARTKGHIGRAKTFCVILDSLFNPYDTADQRLETIDIIRDYLELEYEHKHDKTKFFDRSLLGELRPQDLPQQKNDYDCGYYLLKFAQDFLTAPPKERLLTPNVLWYEWYLMFEDVTLMRKEVSLTLQEMKWQRFQQFDAHRRCLGVQVVDLESEKDSTPRATKRRISQSDNEGMHSPKKHIISHYPTANWDAESARLMSMSDVQKLVKAILDDNQIALRFVSLQIDGPRFLNLTKEDYAKLNLSRSQAQQLGAAIKSMVNNKSNQQKKGMRLRKSREVFEVDG